MMTEEFKKGEHAYVVLNRKVMECTIVRDAKTDPMEGRCYRIEVGVRHKPIVHERRLFRDYDEAEEALQRELNADIWPDELHDMDDRRHWI